MARSGAVAIIPSIRNFKIADNQSPQPQNRIYSSFNYYDNLNYQVNSRLGSPLSDFQVYRYIVGFEKTVLDGNGSFGMRLPIDTLSTNSKLAGIGGTSTSTGDPRRHLQIRSHQRPFRRKDFFRRFGRLHAHRPQLIRRRKGIPHAS